MTRKSVSVEITPPHSLEAEAAVLGGLLLHDDRFIQVSAQIGVNDFYRTANAQIFSVMQVLHERQASIDLITIKNALGAKLEDVGGAAYISGLVDGLPARMNVEEHAKIVHEKARLRRVLAVAKRIEQAALSGEQPSAITIDLGVSDLVALARESGPRIRTAHAAATAYLQSLESDTAICWPTGFTRLDAIMRGVRAGEVIVIGGRPSAGKTSLGLLIAWQLAKRDVETAVFSREMSAEALASRLIGFGSHIPAAKLERKEVEDSQYQQITHAWNALDGIPLSIETNASTVTQIASICERMRHEQNLQCIVIDYLQKLLPEGRHESRESAVAHVSSSLQRLAREQKIAVVVLAQLARASDKRRDKRPRLIDLRESGAVEADADVVVLLYRPEMHGATAENAGVAEAIVAKQRSGPTGVAKLAFVKELAMFANLETEQDEPQ